MSENISPPMPLVIGSVTFRAALAATAASKALPPCIKIRRPAIEASDCVVETMPLLETIIERRDAKRSPEMPSGLFILRATFRQFG